MNLKKWQTYGKAALIGAFALSLSTNDVQAQKKGKWVSLFDGKTFNGWHSWQKNEVLPQWKIEDGAMVLTEKGGRDLVTDKEYGDFELELEWKISEKGNSGIIYHVIEDKKYCCPYSTGPEIQVLDDQGHPDAKAGKDGNHKAGSLYDMLPPSNFGAVKPAGEWNTSKIGPEWTRMIANSKFKTWDGFGAFNKGKIALQDHGDKVSYRKIRIKEL